MRFFRLASTAMLKMKHLNGAVTMVNLELRQKLNPCFLNVPGMVS